QPCNRACHRRADDWVHDEPLDQHVVNKATGTRARILPASRKYFCSAFAARELKPPFGQQWEKRLIDPRQKLQWANGGESPVVVGMGFGHRRTMALEHQHLVATAPHLLPAPPPVATSFPASGLAECAMIDFAVFATIEVHSLTSALVVGGKNDEAFAARDVFDTVLGVVGITADEATQSILDMRCHNGAGVVPTDDQRVLVAPSQPRRLAIDVAVGAVADLEVLRHMHHEHDLLLTFVLRCERRSRRLISPPLTFSSVPAISLIAVDE